MNRSSGIGRVFHDNHEGETTHRVGNINCLLYLRRLLPNRGKIGHLAQVGGKATLKARSGVIDGLGVAGHEATTISRGRGIAA